MHTPLNAQPIPKSEVERRPSPFRAQERFYVFLRYAVALFLLIYGFSKLTGAQFTILDSELDKRMGRVSGFWLTLYYFSYSKAYGSFLALVQIAGAILLMFRKTTLLAVCLLLPILINIVLIDAFYGIESDALLTAALLLVGVLLLAGMHREELVEVLWHRQNRLFPGRPGTLPAALGTWAARFAMVLGAAAFTYWVANYNNRAPTPIDGAWHVLRVQPAAAAKSLPGTIFFERNRAHLCVFKSAEGDYRWRHFELDPRAHSIDIWQEWLRKGPHIFSGHYELFGERLTLTGTLLDGARDATIILEKAD